MDVVLLIPPPTERSWGKFVSQYLASCNTSEVKTFGLSHGADLETRERVRTLLSTVPTVPATEQDGRKIFCSCRTELLQGEELRLGFFIRPGSNVPRTASVESSTDSECSDIADYHSMEENCSTVPAKNNSNTLPPVLEDCIIPPNVRGTGLAAFHESPRNSWIAEVSSLSILVHLIQPLAAANQTLTNGDLLRSQQPWLSPAYPANLTDKKDTIPNTGHTEVFLVPENQGILLTAVVPMCVESTYLNQALYFLAALVEPPTQASGYDEASQLMSLSKSFISTFDTTRTPYSITETLQDLCSIASDLNPSAACSHSISVLYTKLFTAPLKPPSQHSIKKNYTPLQLLAQQDLAATAAMLAARGSIVNEDSRRRRISAHQFDSKGSRSGSAPLQNLQMLLSVLSVVVVSPLRLSHATSVAGRVCFELVNTLHHTGVILESCTAPCLPFCSTQVRSPVRLEPGSAYGIELGALGDECQGCWNYKSSTTSSSIKEHLKTYRESLTNNPSTRVIVPLNVAWSLADAPKRNVVWARFAAEVDIAQPAPLKFFLVPATSTLRSPDGLLYASAALRITNQMDVEVDLKLHLQIQSETNFAGDLIPLQTEFHPLPIPPRESTTIDLAFCSSRHGTHNLPHAHVEIADCDDDFKLVVNLGRIVLL